MSDPLNDSQAPTAGSSYPRLKVLYLLAVTIGVFLVPPIAAKALPGAEGMRFVVVGALLLLQVGLLLRCRIAPGDILAAAMRLRWLYVFLILFSALLRDLDGDVFAAIALPGGLGWTLQVNLTGVGVSLLMCLQIMTVVLVSSVIQVSGSGTDLVDGLRGLKFPRLFVYSIDNTLALMGTVGRRRMGKRKGGGRGNASGGRRAAEQSSSSEGPGPSFLKTLSRLMRGDIAFFLDAIRDAQQRSRRRMQETLGERLDPRVLHDVAVISGIGFMMASMKIIKLAPGVPFASGYKTLFLIPLYILASRLTYSRWGGTTAGTIMGVIGLMMGDGRMGVFEVFKHVAPGVLLDVLAPVVNRLPRSRVLYCALGFLAAVARTSAEFLIIAIPVLSSGTPLLEVPELQIFPAAKLVPNLIFGTLSGMVTYYVVGAFERRREETAEEAADQPPESAAELSEVGTDPVAPDA